MAGNSGRRGRITRRIVGALAFFVVASSPLAARAEPEWMLPVGINLGAAFHPGDVPTGAVIGAEASLAHIDWSGGHWLRVPEFWRGLYVDALYDTGARRGRIGLGPEIGYMIFGIDGGLVADVDGARMRYGFAFRPLVTIGFVSLYTRFGFLPADDVPNRFVETGILAKFPIGLDESF